MPRYPETLKPVDLFRNLGAFFAALGAAKNRAIRLNKVLTGFPPVKTLYRFYPLRGSVSGRFLPGKCHIFINAGIPAGDLQGGEVQAKLDLRKILILCNT
jgi:hypothetical protein